MVVVLRVRSVQQSERAHVEMRYELEMLGYPLAQAAQRRSGSAKARTTGERDLPGEVQMAVQAVLWQAGQAQALECLVHLVGDAARHDSKA